MKTIIQGIFFTFCYIVLLSLGLAQHAEKTGILILAHGGSKTWENLVQDAVRPLEMNSRVEVAFGMADPHTIQQGISLLQKQGVTSVVVVPLFISSHSPILRQTEFLLGLRTQLADAPMMNHSGHAGQSQSTPDHHNHDTTVDEIHSNSDTNRVLRPLDIEAKIIMTSALDDHPLIAEILYERILALSQHPENETVIIVAHGPNDEDDNIKWLNIMERLADQVRELYQRKKTKRFKNIFCMTVRDDAEKSIHDQAKEHLRSLVRQAGKDGKALVVPLFLSHGGVESKIVKRLEGLDYVWDGKTLLPHNNITRFIEASVRRALQSQ